MESTDLRERRGRETRQAIIAAAMDVLMEDGPKGFSASKLAAKAKISKANIFHHFESIDDIPFAVLEQMISSFSGLMTEQKPKSVRRYVEILGQGIIEAPEEMRKLSAAFAHFYIRSAHDEKFRKLQEQVTLKMVGEIERGFQGILKRPLSKKEREVAPLLVAMSLEGMGMFAITFKDKELFREAWRALAGCIDGMLSPK